MYVVLQINSSIYGVANTEVGAISLAKEWVDNPETLEDDLVAFRNATYGDLVVLPCTTSLAASVGIRGGDIAYDITDGVAHIPGEEI